MTAVLLDTGFIVALLDRSERHHRACVDIASTISGPLVTCEPVIAEACYLLRALAGAPQAVLKNVHGGNFQIPFQLTQDAAPVAELMTRYENVPMDFADACLVSMASSLDTGRILTLDSDFHIYRWRGKRRFEVLPSP